MALICVARTAVERRKARAPEALANGNIRRCGAPPCPKRERMATFAGVARRQDMRLTALRLPFYWEALGRACVGIAWQSSGAKVRRENDVSCRRGRPLGVPQHRGHPRGAPLRRAPRE